MIQDRISTLKGVNTSKHWTKVQQSEFQTRPDLLETKTKTTKTKEKKHDFFPKYWLSQIS